MKYISLIIAVSLLVGGIISYLCFGKNNKVKYVDATLNIEELKKVKELHLITHYYEDIIFLHKNDDTTKFIQAIITVPVQITGFVDLEKCTVDTLKKILLVPYPEVTEPTYSPPQAKHVRKVFFGKPADYIQRFSNILVARRPLIIAKAKAGKILEQAKQECESYFSNLFHSLKVNYRIEFMPQKEN